MTSEQRWDKIYQTLDYVAARQCSHDELIGKLVEQADRNERLIGTLAERTIQAMDAINRLAKIAVSHEDRIDKLENGSRLKSRFSANVFLPNALVMRE